MNYASPLSEIYGLNPQQCYCHRLALCLVCDVAFTASGAEGTGHVSIPRKLKMDEMIILF